MWGKIKANLLFFITLWVISIGFYMLHYLIFGDIKDTISGVILSLAYVPIGIMYEVLILNRILETREKIKSGKKMNIIIGSFFYQIGNEILGILVKGDENIKELEEYYHLNIDWEEENFEKLIEVFKDYRFSINIDNVDLDRLNFILEKEGKFLISLIINPMIDEYEDFTSLLIALVHLRDELNTRYKDNIIIDYDKVHVTLDMGTVYKFIFLQWVDYMKHLKKFYPMLYIKELINSPFETRTKKEKEVEYLYKDN